MGDLWFLKTMLIIAVIAAVLFFSIALWYGYQLEQCAWQLAVCPTAEP